LFIHTHTHTHTHNCNGRVIYYAIKNFNLYIFASHQFTLHIYIVCVLVLSIQFSITSSHIVYECALKEYIGGYNVHKQGYKYDQLVVSNYF
jgi:hypothetical protein